MKAKILALLSFSLLACVSSFGQVRTDINVREKNNSSYESDEPEFNAHSFSLGAGLGATKMYGDLAYSNPQPAYIGYLEKNLSPFISYGWTVTVGDLSSRDPHTHLRSFNHFTSIDQHITFELGTIFAMVNKEYDDNMILKLLGGIYAGTGLGIINNDLKRIAAEHYPGNTPETGPTIITNSTALYVPINVGLNFHVPRMWKFKGCVFNANFQYTSTMSDYIDGYKLNYLANKKNDVYIVGSVGLRFFVFQPSNNY